jgi:hypothetical protein
MPDFLDVELVSTMFDIKGQRREDNSPSEWVIVPNREMEDRGVWIGSFHTKHTQRAPSYTVNWFREHGTLPRLKSVPTKATMRS